MRHTTHYRILLACIISMMLFGPALAEEIEITTGEYPPYISESLEGQGITSKIVTEACARAGVTAKIKFYPWARAYAKVEAGQAQASFFFLQTEERLGQVAFGAQHVQVGPTAVFYKKSSFPEGINFTSYADLAKFKVVGVNGYWYESEFKKIGKDDVHYVTAEDLALKLLDSGRADVYVSDMLTGIYLAQQTLGEKAGEIGHSQLQQDAPKGYIIFPKTGSDELRTKLDNALKSMHEDGTFNKLMGL